MVRMISSSSYAAVVDDVVRSGLSTVCRRIFWCDVGESKMGNSIRDAHTDIEEAGAGGEREGKTF
jgi:hypothetical protein